MSRWLRLLVPVFSLTLLAALAWGEEAPQQPYTLVRSLRRLQDQAALGSKDAHALQRTLMAQIAQKIRQARPEAWREPRNMRAVIVYVLSGGDPGVLRGLLKAGALAGVDENLLKGTLAYGEGRNAEAAQFLAGLDARSLDPVLAGHVALVQAMLAEKNDAGKAVILFDDARLLSPGTLIEEAALRREALLIAASGKPEGFEMLAAQYFRRFGHSVYAGNFRWQFAAVLAGPGYGDDAGPLARLAPVLEALNTEERRELYLWTAQLAVVKGKAALTCFAAEQAAPLVETQSAEGVRLRLYHAAALVAGEAFEKGLAMLKSIDRAVLSGQEADLLDAALSVGEQVQHLPEAHLSGAWPQSEANTPGRAGKSGLDDGRIAAGRARTVIGQADQLLGRAKK